MCVPTIQPEDRENSHGMVVSPSSSFDEAEDCQQELSSSVTRSSSRQRERGLQRRASLKRTFVEHSYHDHLHDPVEESYHPLKTVPTKNKNKGPRGGPRGGVTVAFPEKLHEMLKCMDEEGATDVISWQAHGRCFLIHKKNEFVNDIMPRFFHQSKLTSFQRQLNLYGFVRLTAGHDRGAYYHELFLRGRPDLCRQMARTRIKGNGMKAASSPSTEPNFYAMEYCFDHEDVSTTKEISESAESVEEMETEEVNEAPPTPLLPAKENSEKPPTETILLPAIKGALPCSFGMLDRSKAPSDCKSCLLPLKPMPSLPAPMLITPPDSPMQTETATLLDIITPIPMPLPSSQSIVDSDDIEPPMEIETMMQPKFEIPSDIQTGDAAFFEGLKFRYLDHLDMDDVADAFTNENVSTISCI